jgi:hypothetical protein
VIVGVAAGDAQERLLQRAALQAQLVQDGALGRGELADLLAAGAADDEGVVVVADP